MSPGDSEAIKRIVQVFADTIADSGKLRDGLTDDEAIPLVDWGLAYASAYAQAVTGSSAPLPSEQQISDQAYNLTRLMTGLNWVATYHDKKDADWLTKTLLMVNKLSQDLWGADAPVMPEDAIAGWLAAQQGRSVSDMLHDLMARFAPPTTKSPTAGPPSGAAVAEGLPSPLSMTTGTMTDAEIASPTPPTLLGTLLSTAIDVAPGEAQPAGPESQPPAAPLPFGGARLPRDVPAQTSVPESQPPPSSERAPSQGALPGPFGGRGLPRRDSQPEKHPEPPGFDADQPDES